MILFLSHIAFLVQQAAPDSAGGDVANQPVSTAYDSIWAAGDVPTQPPTALEQVMLADDKLFVVLAVVLIIWIGLVMLLVRNDRKLKQLERTAREHITENDPL